MRGGRVFLVILGAVGIVYVNALHGHFLYGDYLYPYGNSQVRDWANIPRFFFEPKLLLREVPPGGHYRPMTETLHALSPIAG
ncbi:MAG: hypothetical protein HY760_02450 [Nitrospirae bacterium]|nr:hypothetical protein [Nitrospirota bacterium]